MRQANSIPLSLVFYFMQVSPGGIVSFIQRAAISILGLLCLVLIPSTGAMAGAPEEYEPLAARQVIQKAFPSVDDISPREDNRAIQELRRGEELLGYAYQTLDFVQTPAYSGKPLNAMVVLDTDGEIKGARVIHHDEPILLIGIPEIKMHDFTDQYVGLKADQRVTVGGKSSERRIAVDGLSGATVTVMVINEVIMKTAHRIGAELGLVEGGDEMAKAVENGENSPPNENDENGFHRG